MRSSKGNSCSLVGNSANEHLLLFELLISSLPFRPCVERYIESVDVHQSEL